MKLSKEILKMIPLYTYRIEWSDEDQLFIVSVEELPNCMTHGKTHTEALNMGYEAVQCHIEGLAKDNIDIPKPFALQKFKGEFIVRATPELHKKIAIESAKHGYKSLNKFIVQLLEKAVS